LKIIDCEQRSEEWFEARLGIPTSSNFNKIVTSEGKPSKQAKNYLHKLAGEFVSGAEEESYQSIAMIKGIEKESDARTLYELIEGTEVEEVGFCLEGNYGASPDGLVGDNGEIEIKCPIISTHVSYLLNRQLPTEYFQQVQGQMLVTGRDWCDFMSFYPGLKPLIVRVHRDEKFISLLLAELKIFCERLSEVIERIK